MKRLKFDELFVDSTKFGKKIPTEKYLETGKNIIVDQSKKEIAGYSNDEEGLYKDIPAIIFGDHTRIIKYVDKPFFLGADGTKIIKSKIHNANYKYLYYALKNAHIIDTGYNRHFKWLKESEFNFHDEKKQTEIVNQLDAINKLIENKRKLLELLDELVKARFVEMFDSINNNKFGYEIKTLQEVCEPIKDGTHQTPTYTEDTINGYKFLSSKDVVTGQIDWDHLKYIPKELHNDLYKRISPRKGDILLAKNGTTGIAAIVDKDEVFDIYVSLALLRPLEGVNNVFLCSAVNSQETKRQFNERLKGVGVPNLHLGEIKQTKIVVPPLEKQIEFAEFVKQIDKSKVVVQAALVKAQLLFDSLMQEYFG